MGDIDREKMQRNDALKHRRSRAGLMGVSMLDEATLAGLVTGFIWDSTKYLEQSLSARAPWLT